MEPFTKMLTNPTFRKFTCSILQILTQLLTNSHAVSGKSSKNQRNISSIIFIVHFLPILKHIHIARSFILKYCSKSQPILPQNKGKASDVFTLLPSPGRKYGETHNGYTLSQTHNKSLKNNRSFKKKLYILCQRMIFLNS